MTRSAELFDRALGLIPGGVSSPVRAFKAVGGSPPFVARAEGARIVDEEPPGLSTEDVREHLDPVEFIKRHNNLGDPAPQESRRMIGLRRKTLAEAKNRHAQRLARLEKAAKKLDAEIEAVLGRVSSKGSRNS